MRKEKCIWNNFEFLGHENIVNLLIGKCARVNVKTKKDERTPLHLAAMNGNLQCIEQAFVGKNWNCNIILNKSTLSGYDQIILKLVSSGANKEFQDRNSKTAYDLAMLNGNL